MGGLQIAWDALDAAAQQQRDNEQGNRDVIENGPPPDNGDSMSSRPVGADGYYPDAAERQQHLRPDQSRSGRGQ
jgi:hypothetical protein